MNKVFDGRKALKESYRHADRFSIVLRRFGQASSVDEARTIHVRDTAMSRFFKLISKLHLPGRLLSAGCAFGLLMWTTLGSAEQALILGVHPYLPQEEIKRRFAPLAEYLQQALTVPVRVRVGQSYHDHLDTLGQGNIDIAYLGPASYVATLQEDLAYPLLARLEARGKPTFQGHIIVSQESKLSQLGDLRGKIFAFGYPHSTMSTLVPRAMLAEAGLGLQDLAAYRHYAGHVNVALAVLGGDADAGAVKEEVYLRFRERGLRSLAATPAISEHVFVTRAGLDPSQVKQIKDLLLSIRSAEQVHRLIEPIKRNATGLVPASPSDYDNLRRLLDRLNS